MKIPNRISIVFSGITGLVGLGLMSTIPPQEEKPEYKNLKVLSRSLDDDQMEEVMHSFNRQLGVTCIYCHVRDNSNPPKADFASDVKTEKLIAREMLKMTIKLNNKYFDAQMNGKLKKPAKIWCGTCHHGIPRPEPPRK